MNQFSTHNRQLGKESILNGIFRHFIPVSLAESVMMFVPSK